MMRLKFLGAAQTVTGSKYLLESNGTRVLVDCGLFQGLKELRLRNWDDFPISPASIDAVIITHAHIDHTGYLPVLARNGFKGPIYASTATHALCRLLLPDSAHLQEEEARYANKKGYSKHKVAKPLYNEEDAEKTLALFRSKSFDTEFDLPGGLKGMLRSSGHILGSSFVTVSDGKRSITFSGDLGRQKDLVLRPPVTVAQSDYLVMESTYGNRIHKDEDLLSQIEQIVTRTAQRKGVVIVPAFAVGRAQSFLYCIYRLKKEKRIPDIPVFLNSPMAINASGIFCDHLGEHRLNPEECEGTCEVSRYITSPEESKALNVRKGPMIIISASGMATGGRVLHHIKAFGPDPRNTIMLTGYQAVGTRGAALAQGAKTLKIHGEHVPIQAEVAMVNGLSGHADQREIIEWMKQFKAPPRVTFITHGELDSATALQQRIGSELGWKSSIPKYCEEVVLE